MVYKEITQLVKKLGDQIAREAGNIKDIGKDKKGLTEKDLFIEESLVSFIKLIDPDAEVFAEELHDKIPQARSVWIIDPISNTFNFIRGLPGYTVVVSHMVENEVVFAVVYDPSTKDIFYAEKGKGLYVNNSISHVKKTDDVVILISGIKDSEVLEQVKGLYDIGVVRNFGSVALHYAYVACGRATVAFTLNKDTFPEFAGKLLVEEGGGIFTDIQNKPLTFLTKATVACSDIEIHAKVLNLNIDFGFTK